MSKTKKLSEVANGSISSDTSFVVINDGKVEQAANIGDVIGDYIGSDVIDTIALSEIDALFQ